MSAALWRHLELGFGKAALSSLSRRFESGESAFAASCNNRANPAKKSEFLSSGEDKPRYWGELLSNGRYYCSRQGSFF